MGIEFGSDRWRKIKANHAGWWRGELDRPLLPITVAGRRDPGRSKPDVPLLSQATCHDLSWTPEEIVDRIDYELSTCVFYGDAFPFVNMHCFGPGVAGAFLGAELDNSTGRVWFHPPSDASIQEIHFRYNPDNVWFRRVRDIYRAAMERWQGEVLMGMADLGGNLDILSTFLPGEKLLLDLYDHPEEVKRLTWEAHEAWHQYYAALNDVLQPINPGYSDWSGIYSAAPAYILQCDFCYMIGPEMFDEFVKPEIVASCQRLDHTIYHLDGVGQLPHLDSLLEIGELNGVQWVPGSGQKDGSEWPEVYQNIAGAGKLMQVLVSFDGLDRLASEIGSGRGMHVNRLDGWVSGKTDGEIRRKLAGYGVE